MKKHPIISTLLTLFFLMILSVQPALGVQESEEFFPEAEIKQTQNVETAGTRRTNIPYFEGTFDWAQSAILWFGINELSLPGKNYVDVRLAYTDQALEVRFTVIDYYLWYNTNPQSGDDLTQYDAVEIYLDTNHDRASQPYSDDYMMLIGSRHFPNDNAPQYHRDARGTGTAWDASWSGAWTDFSAMQWSDTGPNNNSGNIDYGWYAYYTIPWSVLGLAGQPTEGDVWGIGLRLHDRDNQPPAGAVDPQYWPETFQVSNPSTWGEIHFGQASYTPGTTVSTGSTQIRASSPLDNTVEDAWMGGGGTCSAGHEGGSEVNHGDEPELYSGSESAPTHFPCFNKSFLRFQLNSIPPGVEIISATLVLHQFGNADPGIAPPFSWVHLFTISDPWSEMSIHWNNAPLAQENISATWVEALDEFPGWPGIPYSWDASSAVATAYANNNPVNIAIYSSDVGRDTSKYFVGSETGDWNAAARPTLYIVWGEAGTDHNIFLPLILE